MHGICESELHTGTASFFCCSSSGNLLNALRAQPEIGAAALAPFTAKQAQQLLFFAYPDTPWSISPPALGSLLDILAAGANATGLSAPSDTVQLTLQVSFDRDPSVCPAGM